MHSYGRRLSFSACLACLLLAPAHGRPAVAGVIASNLDAGGSFGTGYYNLTGPYAATGLGYGLAVKFTAPGTAPVAFNSAALALWFQGGTDSINVLLLADNGGRPGAILETIQLTGIPAGPSLVVATSSVRTTLSPSKNYWLAAVASNDTFLTWMTNDFGQAGHLAYRTDLGRGPGPWRPVPSNLDPAFAIAADPIQ